MSSLDKIEEDERFLLHRSMFEKYPIKQKVFMRLHHWILQNLQINPNTPDFLGIELGAGAFPISVTEPRIKATDFVPDELPEWIEQHVDACDLRFRDGELHVIVCQNSFHHFQDPLKFLTEAERVLAPGGKIAIFEPYHSPLGNIFFKFLTSTESFDKTGHLVGPADRMLNANQAMSYIVFEREWSRLKNNGLFPKLEICEHLISPYTPSYICCGGVNFKPLVKEKHLQNLVKLDEKFSWLKKYLSLHHLIILERSC